MLEMLSTFFLNGFAVLLHRRYGIKFNLSESVLTLVGVL